MAPNFEAQTNGAHSRSGSTHPARSEASCLTIVHLIPMGAPRQMVLETFFIYGQRVKQIYWVSNSGLLAFVSGDQGGNSFAAAPSKGMGQEVLRCSRIFYACK